MDIQKFFRDLTNGHLLAWKSALATFVVVQAGLQVALAARFWRGGGLKVSPIVAGRVHRWNGRVLLVLSVGLAFVCLFNQAGPTKPVRVLAHTILGCTLLALLTVKLSLVRLTRSGQKWLPLVGILLFANYVAIWFLTVFNYATSSHTEKDQSGLLVGWVIVTGVIAAGLGALGLYAFARRRPTAGAAPAAPAAS